MQIVNLELTPLEFEERVLGAKQDWMQSLLVDMGEQEGMQEALPLGQWLHQQGISVDQQGRAVGGKPSRFAREAGAEQQPCWSGPAAARYFFIHALMTYIFWSLKLLFAPACKCSLIFIH